MLDLLRDRDHPDRDRRRRLRHLLRRGHRRGHLPRLLLRRARPGRRRGRPARWCRSRCAFGGVPLEYAIGEASVGVPGVPAGCGEVHQRWGRLPWAERRGAGDQPGPQRRRSCPPRRPAPWSSVAPALPARASAPRSTRPAASFSRAATCCSIPGLDLALSILAGEGPAAFYTGRVGADPRRHGPGRRRRDRPGRPGGLPGAAGAGRAGDARRDARVRAARPEQHDRDDLRALPADLPSLPRRRASRGAGSRAHRAWTGRRSATPRTCRSSTPTATPA